MKRISCMAALLLGVTMAALSQKQSGPLPYDKEQLDSLFRTLPGFNQPFVLPLPKGYSVPVNPLAEVTPFGNFERANPAAAVISKTKSGIVYSMPLDNMAVLVPAMEEVEKMPGSRQQYQVSTAGNMPNPLLPKNNQRKK